MSRRKAQGVLDMTLLAVPLSLLCLYLAWLSYDKNRQTSLVLLVIGGGALFSCLLLAAFCWILWPTT